jgi:hypothetical protein
MASAYTKQLIRSFVTQYGGDIVEAIANTGLFFPAVVAQLSVESANGTSNLAVRANNFGGIKGNASNGILTTTLEYDSKIPTRVYFKKYNSFREFMSDYVNILQLPRYVSAGVYAALTPEDQIRRIVEGGYATATPDGYLDSGVADRIEATQDIYSIGKIGNVSNAMADAGLVVQRPYGAVDPSGLWNMLSSQL